MTDERGVSLDDEVFTGQLRAVAARVDPPPALLVDFARASLAWRTVDADLAELSYDSAVDATLVDAVRGTVRAPRLLTFDLGETVIEFEVSGEGDRRRLVGQVVPMQPARIEVRHSSGAIAVEADDHGRFAAEGVPPGPVSLRCVLAGGTVLHTDWSTI